MAGKFPNTLNEYGTASALPRCHRKIDFSKARMSAYWSPVSDKDVDRKS